MGGKRNRKSEKALRQGRMADSLSAPLKELGGFQQAQHLGDKTKHDEDALRQEEWIRRQKAAKLGVKPEDLDEAVELAVTADLVGFTGSDRDEEVIKQSEWDEDKLRDDVLGGKGLVISMAYVGEPGHRTWKDLEGAKWVSAMIAEKQLRANYVNASRQAKHNGPKPVQVILARVPPWVGFTVGQVLLKQPRALKERLVRVCGEFSNRYNVDVVGAVVHRESDYDLHIHLVFSTSRERVRPKKMGARKMRDEIKKARDRIRADLRSKNKPATNQAVSAVFKQMDETGNLSRQLESVGTTESIRYERIKDLDAKVRRSTLGHAFLCKMQTWRAADTADKDAVAAFRDRAPDHPRFDRSFRERFARAETRGEKLEDLWWNLWLTERWREVCVDGLNKEISEKSAALGRQMAQDYLRFGSTVPTLTERLTIEKKKLEEKVSAQSERIADLEAKTAELEGKRVSLDDQAKRAELSVEKERRHHMETELSQIHSTLAPLPGESLISAAKRLIMEAAEMVGYKKQAAELTIRLQVAVADSQNTRKENQKLCDELEQSRKTISELLAEIAPLRILKDLVGKLIEALNAMPLPPAVLKVIGGPLQKIGGLVGKTFTWKTPEKSKNEGPQM